MPFRLFVAVLVTAMASPALQAQQVGDRLRVRIADSVFVGEAASVSAAGFELREDSLSLRTFMFASIDGLEMHAGMRSRWLDGLRIGGVTPLYIGGTIVVGCLGSLIALPPLIFLCVALAGPVIAVALPAAVIGAIGGTIIGAFMKTDAWEPVEFSTQMSAFARMTPPAWHLPVKNSRLDIGVRFRLR